jgi:hypothetical protein
MQTVTGGETRTSPDTSAQGVADLPTIVEFFSSCNFSPCDSGDLSVQATDTRAMLDQLGVTAPLHALARSIELIGAHNKLSWYSGS